jgi:hypothetical protein
MQYNVGQVVYLLDSKRNAVLPARVFEQVTKKTINGEEEFFYVEVPGSEELLNISDFEGLVFTDNESVKTHLFDTLRTNIESLVEKATLDAVNKWGETAAPATVEKKRRRGRPKKVDLPKEEAGTLVDLGDGVVGRLKN